MEGISLPDGCLLGLKIEGSACLQLAGTHMDSIGKQVPLLLCHHYMTMLIIGVNDDDHLLQKNK